MRSTAELSAWVRDARRRTLDMVAGLDEGQLMGPRLKVVNPLLWEIGHVAWFQERWVLRHAGGQESVRADADALCDSSAVPHDIRWDLPLPSRDETLAYMREVKDRVLRMLEERPTGDVNYFAEYTVYHEDMHDEAFAYTRQTLAHPPPPGGGADDAPAPARKDRPRARGPATPTSPAAPSCSEPTQTERFVFDNEKWAHSVDVAPFRIARAPVTAGEFAQFVDDGGYARAPTSGRRRAGPGAPRAKPRIRCTGGAGRTAGSGATSTAGCRSSRTGPSST